MIQIDLKLFNKVEELSLTEFLLLCVLYEDPSIYNYGMIGEEETIKILEDFGYIRIIDDICIMDSKAINLFESNPLVKKAKEILDYMNELKSSISKRPFSYNTHGKDILARLGEKNQVDEIKHMLKFMYNKWIGTDMQDYLRPSTLFNKTKFYNYMEQAEMGKNKIDIKQSIMDDE